MKKELEQALNNVNSVCANTRLTRDEHVVLVNNLELIRNTLIEAEQDKMAMKAEKPKKEKVNGKS